MINYLRHKDLDLKKWDNCIDNAINGLPYAYSWYLNIAAEEQWDALVLDDYEAVFPLPFKNRLVFKQIYQPFFVQQLGLFFTKQDHEMQLHYFINAMPSSFRKVNLHLNINNAMSESFLKVKHKLTHHIDLADNYKIISEDYNANTRRNLKKARSFKLRVSNAITPSELIELRKKYLGQELKGIQNQEDQARLQRLMEKAMSINKGFITGIYDENENVLAQTFFLNSNRHIIYLSPVSTYEGKEKQAMTLLIDHILKEYAGSSMIFDFEGSMLAGVARFYKGFGAVEVNFPVIVK
ncbi:MAG: hypothetical protein ACHQFW_08485 [Chitinophagales bacterium]